MTNIYSQAITAQGAQHRTIQRSGGGPESHVMQIDIGGDPANAEKLLSAANPLPVKGTGTAGSPGTDVLTVQGIGSGTPVPVSGTVAFSNSSISVSGSSVTVSGAVTVTGNVAGTGTAGSPAAGVLTVQGINGGTDLIIKGSGTAGAPNAGVVSVQGISGGTNLNVAVANSPTVSISSGTVGVSGNVNVVGTGSAGTPASGVVSVQGIASGTAVSVAAAASAPVAVRFSDGSAFTNQPIVGSVAHGATDSGNPLKIGAKATTSPSGLTLVSDGQRTDLSASVDGSLFTRQVALGDIVQGSMSTTGTAAQDVIAAVASRKIYITSIIASNSSATNTTVDLINNSVVICNITVPANGGVIWNAGQTPMMPNASGAKWQAQSLVAVSTLKVFMIGFRSAI